MTEDLNIDMTEDLNLDNTMEINHEEDEEIANLDAITEINHEEIANPEENEEVVNPEFEEDEEIAYLEEDVERLNLEAELRCLTSKLCSNNDELGDWKLSKIHEYNLLGLKCPYTEKELNTYHTERQKIRDRINEIEERLSLM